MPTPVVSRPRRLSAASIAQRLGDPRCGATPRDRPRARPRRIAASTLPSSSCRRGRSAPRSAPAQRIVQVAGCRRMRRARQRHGRSSSRPTTARRRRTSRRRRPVHRSRRLPPRAAPPADRRRSWRRCASRPAPGRRRSGVQPPRAPAAGRRAAPAARLTSTARLAAAAGALRRRRRGASPEPAHQRENRSVSAAMPNKLSATMRNSRARNSRPAMSSSVGSPDSRM